MIQHTVLAPCGLDCRLCSAYQRKRKPCPGCGGRYEEKPYHCQTCAILMCEERWDDERAYETGAAALLPTRQREGPYKVKERRAAETGADGGFCFACDKFPCRRLKQLDKRYREKYHMSLLDNLAYLEQHGEDAFLEANDYRWKCAGCGELICVHRNQCIQCGAQIDWALYAF